MVKNEMKQENKTVTTYQWCEIQDQFVVVSSTKRVITEADKKITRDNLKAFRKQSEELAKKFAARRKNKSK